MNQSPTWFEVFQVNCKNTKSICTCVHLNHRSVILMNKCIFCIFAICDLNLFCSDFTKKEFKWKQCSGDKIQYIWYFFYVLVFRKYNIYIVWNANATSFWSFYVFRRRASRFEITVHKTLSLNDEFNDTTWKKESATRLQTRALHTKTPFCH